MKTAISAHGDNLAWLWVLYCSAMAFGFVFAGCSEKARLLHNFSELEKKALRYGTVSVGAVRVTDYDNLYLKNTRKQLETSLNKFRTELRGDLNKSLREQSAPKLSGEKQKPDGEVPGQAPGPSEVELVGLRMAALKFIESELEDLNLDCIFETEPNFRRLEISLDCSAWVRGKAGASLVYIDLYPYRADEWCHAAAEALENLLNNRDQTMHPGQEPYPEKWRRLMISELGDGFKSLDSSKTSPPDKKKIRQEVRWDMIGFCHRWLGEKNLLPRIVHVERMGKTEYLIWTESDYSSSEFGINAGYPAGLSAKLGVEARQEAKRHLASVRPLSLAFIAGDRRAGWLFMPGKTTEGKMAPTERRLRMVVDIPDKMSRLAVHVHKTFLGPDLGVLPGAEFNKQMENLARTRKMLIRADELYERYKLAGSEQYKTTEPEHCRLIKTRIRNLLYQGWAEEIIVRVPEYEGKSNISCH